MELGSGAFPCHLVAVSKIIGIDLGTTNSAVAVVEAGIPGLLADEEGRRLLPSVVRFDRGDAAVGWEARRGMIVHPRDTVYSAKRLMGRRLSEVEASAWPFDLVEKQGKTAVAVGGDEYLPEEVAAEVLRVLKERTEAALGESVGKAVITVPAYFNDAQRHATKQAGELAGLEVERVLNEPTAAALAFGLNRGCEKARIAVYDLGGGTFDLSILELREGVFEVVATHGNTHLGGDDIDARVTDWLKEEILKGGGPDQLDSEMLARVRAAAEAAKVALSTENETEIALPFLAPDFSFKTVLVRGNLERMTKGVLDLTRNHCRQALADAGLEPEDLDEVILVGGQTRMPLVRRLVGEWFGCVEYEEARGGVRLGTDYHEESAPRLNTSQNPDEAVALGAALQGAILSGEMDRVLLLDVTPLSLGLETFGGLMNVIIPRNSTIPTKAGELFTNAVDGQREMLIHVLQGEREKAGDNWSLGRFAIDFVAAKRGAARVGVQFEIDVNGILNVLARDTETGREKIVKMESAVDVDDAKVQQMVEESVENAFEDMDARRWVEAALKAREALGAARQGMEDFRKEINCDGIEEAIRGVENALSTEEDGLGDLGALKSSVGALDRATQPLADLMMDRAMEEMLRRRGMLD